MNSDLARLPDKALNTFCARRWGGFAGVFWEALAKRQRQKGRRGSQPPRRFPTHKRFAVEKTDKSSGGGQRKGGKRGRGDTTRNKRREPTVLDVVADRWKPASLLALSGVPGASPVERGRVRDAGHRIGSHRTERAFGTRDWKRKNIRRVLKIFGERFEGRGWRCSKWFIRCFHRRLFGNSG
jgi:hypothetical protein